MAVPNLQGTLTPVEEAAAYRRLIENGRHTDADLGNSSEERNYITRLKFTALSSNRRFWKRTMGPSAWVLKFRYVGTFSVRCTKKHLQDEGTYNSWRGLKAADVARRIQTELHHRPAILPLRQDRVRHVRTQHQQPGCCSVMAGGHCANRTPLPK